MDTLKDIGDVLTCIQTNLINAADLDLQQFRQALERSEHIFANILDYKGKDAEARKQVQSCNVQTKLGSIILDLEPDVAQILLLSDEFSLHELDALEYVVAARNLVDDVSAASAAGVFFGQRYETIKTLSMLLHAALGSMPLPLQAQTMVAKFVQDLLSKSEGGKSVSLNKLANALQSDAFDDTPESRLHHVIDEFGRAIDRRIVVQREKTALCELLLYVCWVKKQFVAQDFYRLLDVLHHLTLKVKHGNAPFSVQLQATLTTVSTLLTILPPDNLQGEDVTFADWIDSKDVETRVSSFSATDQPYSSLIKLTWGVVALAAHRPGTPANTTAVKILESGIETGALRFAKDGILHSVPMLDEPEDIREMVAVTMFSIIELIMQHTPQLLGTLEVNSAANPIEGLESGSGGNAGGANTNTTTAMVVVQMKTAGTNLNAPPPKPDTLATFLDVIAAAIEIQPMLTQTDPHRTVLGDILQLIGDAQQPLEYAAVFISFIRVWGAYASTEEGARIVFSELRSENAFPGCNWHKMFDLLLTVIRLYQPQQESDTQGTAPGRRPQEVILDTANTMGICAYVDLFTKVMTSAPVDELPNWLRQLESEAGVSPVYEVLFQAMCAPVPQLVKASLDNAIASLARKPEIAAALWERLLAAVVVQRPAMGELVARYDLGYQLNEIEARSEDYVESVAFIRLLNALWRGEAASLADGGAHVAHFTKFIREDILGTIYQRTFKDESQRWELLAVCLEHCDLCVKLSGGRAVFMPQLTSSGAATAMSTDGVGGGSLQRVSPAPGTDIMMDLASEGCIARAALAALSSGTDVLAEERYAAAYGPAKEVAVLAALSLFRAALDAITEAGSSLQPGMPTVVDMLATHDRRRLPLLLDFVRYPHNVAVQKESIRLTTHLAERVPNLVALLLTAPPDGRAPIALRLQDGFASCLRDSILSPAGSSHPESSTQATENNQGGGDGVPSTITDASDDSPAALVLHLLLLSLELPAPNLTHMLCGYEVEGGMGPVALLGPLGFQTPLTAALDIVLDQRSTIVHPRSYEQCLELLYALCAAHDTGPATLDLLFSYSGLLNLVEDVLTSRLPSDGGPSWATAVHQRAWLLQLVALLLRCADVAVGVQKEMVHGLLKVVFGASDGGLALKLLTVAAAEPPMEPQLAAGAEPEVQRIMQTLEFGALLASPYGAERGGVGFVSGRGEVLIDIVALKDELLKRYAAWTAEQGAATEALRKACHLALTYAQEHNTFVERIGGQVALLDAWQATVTAAFEQCFDALTTVVGGPPDVVTLMMETMERCSRTLPPLLLQHSPLLALPVTSVVQTVMSRLRCCLATADASSVMNLAPHPHRCHSLLDALLGRLWEARKHAEVRMQLYTALVAYLKLCQGPVILQLPKTALEAAAMNGGGVAGALQQVETLQDRLEHGNLGVLAAHSRVLQGVFEDSVSASPQMATVALTTISTLIATDTSLAVAEDVYRSGLPGRLLQQLPDALHTALTQPPPAGQAQLVVVEAQLSLLVGLSVAGAANQKGASAQRLFSLQAIPRLTQCAALDLQPEEPGFGTAAAWETSFRHRLRLVITPTLRLVLGMLSALPDSAALREQAAAFVDARARTLTRLLHEAASSNVRGWEPGEAELEQATLTAQLLTELAPHRQLLSSGPQLQEAAYRAATRFLCADSASQSAVVAKLVSARQHGSRAWASVQGLRLKVVSLRCALCAYLQQLSQQGTVFMPTRQAEIIAGREGVGGAPTIMLLKDGLIQAAAEDLPETLNPRNALLSRLQAQLTSASVQYGVNGAGATNGIGGDGGLNNNPASLGGLGDVESLTVAVSHQEAIVSKLYMLVEMLLAVIFQQLRHLRTNAGSLDTKGISTDRLFQEMEQLCRMLEPAIIQLMQQTSNQVGFGDAHRGLDLLLQMLTKECHASSF